MNNWNTPTGASTHELRAYNFNLDLHNKLHPNRTKVTQRVQEMLRNSPLEKVEIGEPLTDEDVLEIYRSYLVKHDYDAIHLDLLLDCVRYNLEVEKDRFNFSTMPGYRYSILELLFRLVSVFQRLIDESILASKEVNNLVSLSQ